VELKKNQPVFEDRSTKKGESVLKGIPASGLASRTEHEEEKKAITERRNERGGGLVDVEEGRMEVVSGEGKKRADYLIEGLEKDVSKGDLL